FPERYSEFHRLDGFATVENDGLAVCLDFFATPGPQIGVPKGRPIAERVRERLAQRPMLCFELRADRVVLLPGFGKRVGLDAFFREPRRAVGEQHAEDREGHREPLLAVIGDVMRGLEITALSLADLLG